MQRLDGARAIQRRFEARRLEPDDWPDLSEEEEFLIMEVEALIRKWLDRVAEIESAQTRAIHYDDCYYLYKQEASTLTDCAKELEAALKKARGE